MSLHTLRTGKSFTAIRALVRFLTCVYNPDVLGKGTSLTKPSTAHRTVVGFLSIVYNPNVYAKDPSR